MPIYEYRCGDCGQTKDYLQKVSDAPMDTCPACGSKAFSKALTAPGFQLKGNGWYATDFKTGGGNTSKPSVSTSASSASDTKTESPKTDSPAADTSSKTESTGGGGCNTGCACH